MPARRNKTLHDLQSIAAVFHITRNYAEAKERSRSSHEAIRSHTTTRDVPLKNLHVVQLVPVLVARRTNVDLRLLIVGIEEIRPVRSHRRGHTHRSV